MLGRAVGATSRHQGICDHGHRRGFLGGKLIAPLFITAAAVPADFSMATLFVAAAVAASFLFVGNAVNARWGV